MAFLYFVGLGSNLGAREQTIRRAVDMLEKRIGNLLGLAPFVYSEPVGFVSEHEFCNTAALYESVLQPMEVLAVAQDIEQQLGREKHQPLMLHGVREYTDRTIDIDLLTVYANGLEITCNTPALTLPHPQMDKRDFVQLPLLQLVQNMVRQSVVHFTKMHGLGNDYIYFDGVKSTLPHVLLPVVNTYAPLLCDRHKGIGADGLVFILPDSEADFRMRIFNADGSEAEMCGNASRCVALYVWKHRYLQGKTLFRLATGGGIRTIDIRDAEHIAVDMGLPQYKGTASIGGRTYHLVDVGNPHAITILGDNEPLSRELVHTVGPQVEHDPLFPNRTNTEFCVVLDRHHVVMRVWERGSGETQACGTGATATACACVQAGLCDSPVQVTLLGGTLTIEIHEHTAYMIGSATEVFDGWLK